MNEIINIDKYEFRIITRYRYDDKIKRYVRYISVQVHKKILWITFWSYLKTYIAYDNNTYNIQLVNANRFINKIRKRYEKQLR